jgi:hypothetical protein
MIFSTFEKRAGDAVSIFGNSGTDLYCRWVTGIAHEKSLARERAKKKQTSSKYVGLDRSLHIRTSAAS